MNDERGMEKLKGPKEVCKRSKEREVYEVLQQKILSCSRDSKTTLSFASLMIGTIVRDN